MKTILFPLLRNVIILIFFFSLKSFAQVFYGITTKGGADGVGTIFKYDNNTSEITSVPSFKKQAFGANPYYTELVEYQGKIYGMTHNGGKSNLGVIFEWDPVTNAYTKKIDFNGLNGKNPYGDLILFNNKFYGTTSKGGANDMGVIFEWDPVTNIYIKKMDFDYNSGYEPLSSFILFNNKLYCMTSRGGTSDVGVIFEWDPVTNIYTKRVNFNMSNGGRPNNNKLTYFAGKFYGMTTYGGTDNEGAIFEWNPVTNVCVGKISFSEYITGMLPTSSLIEWGGKFYGTTQYGGSQQGALFEWDPVTNIYTKKVNFAGVLGEHPSGSLISFNNKIYGTTASGGVYSPGTIFEWDPVTSTHTVKATFNFITSGMNPLGGLLTYNGKFYGMTKSGGVNNSGTIFEWNTTSNQPIKKIEFNSTNGENPHSSLTYFAGKFYGTTRIGGTNNQGVLFEWDPSTNIYSQKVNLDSTNGYSPLSSLTSLNGKFYGMTEQGGDFGYGVIFEWDPVTNIYTKKINFNGTNGRGPIGGLILHNGKFYGMTTGGGINLYGVIFEWDPVTNIYTKKVDFSNSSGGFPHGSLSLFSGKFYGTTYLGGVGGTGILGGVIFEWDPVTNIYTKKIDFIGTNGESSNSTLTLVRNKFYGTTCRGGLYDNGVLFEWDPVTNIYTKKIDFNDEGWCPTGKLKFLDGKFYGITMYNSENGFGSIFEWDPVTNIYTKKANFNGENGANPMYGELQLASECINTMYFNNVISVDGIVGTPYTLDVSITGNTQPISYSISPSLPQGLNFDVVSGTVTGTPTQPTPSTIYTIKALQANGCSTKQTYTFGICPASITITPDNLPNAIHNTSYNQTLSQTGLIGNNVVWSVIGGIIPIGFSLDSSTGVISGVCNMTGIYTFTVKVAQATCFQTKTYTISVLCPTGMITPPSLPEANLWLPYNQVLSQTGLIGTSTWSIRWSIAYPSELPKGLSLDENTGIISGTPDSIQVSNFRIWVTKGPCGFYKDYTISVVPRGALIDISNNETMNFGDVLFMQSSIKTLTIKNIGSEVMNVFGFSFPSPAFTAQPNTFSLAPNESKNISIIFTPTNVESFEGNIIIQSNKVAGNNSFRVKGNGINPTALSINKNKNFKIFPNPTQGDVSIENKSNTPYQWYLQDILGKTLLKGTSLEEYQKIDMSSLPQGIYTIHIIYQGEKLVIPIIKQ